MLIECMSPLSVPLMRLLHLLSTRNNGQDPKMDICPLFMAPRSGLVNTVHSGSACQFTTTQHLLQGKGTERTKIISDLYLRRLTRRFDICFCIHPVSQGMRWI
jgi:hypothetical protein